MFIGVVLSEKLTRRRELVGAGGLSNQSQQHGENREALNFRIYAIYVSERGKQI